jgi:hypothetical protein
MNASAPPPEPDPRDLTSFDRAGTLVGEFENAIGTYGVAISSKSTLADICLAVLDLENMRLRRVRVNPGTDVRPLFRRAGGLIEFMKLFLRAHSSGRGAPFVAHLELLNKGHISQNEPVLANFAPHDVFDASNKLFELFFGLLCVPLSPDIELDHPVKPTGHNPDILATIDGRRWVFACKVISGHSAITLFDNIAKGIDQIQDSEAEIGVVILKLTNIVDHELTWPLLNPDEVAASGEPILGVRANERTVLTYLHSIHAMKHAELEQVNGRPAIEGLVRGKKTLTGAVSFLQTVTSILSTRGPLPTTVGQLGLMEFDPIAQVDFDVIQRLNEILHSRL